MKFRKLHYNYFIFVAFAVVKTFDDLRDENKGKCNLDMNDILLAFCLIHGAINDRENNFFYLLNILI